MILKKPLRISHFFLSLIAFLLLGLTSCAPTDSSNAPAKYNFIDPQGLIPQELKEQALQYFEAHQNETLNKHDFTIVAFSSTGEKINYQVDMQTGLVLISTEDLSDQQMQDDGLIYTATTQLNETETGGSSNLAEVSPLWESQRPEDGAQWTRFVMETVRKEGGNLIAGSQDVVSFCPTYNQLSSQRKLNFWTYLISAMTQYESGFKPSLRYRESSMGNDPVTGQHVYSEGLLQLSYQDRNPYPFCDEFDWQADRHLAPTDPRKTIFDPYKNLRCGIKILNLVVGRNKLISFNGHYWSVLKPRNSSKRAIQALTNKIPFCQK